MKTVKRKLRDLVFDLKFHTRSMVDGSHVKRMREAEQAGVVFPPYQIDDPSNLVLDGFHRGEKDRLEHGLDYEVECIAKQYKDDGERFADAMRYNAAHGKPLSQFDRAKCALRAKQYGVSAKQIAEALGMTMDMLRAIGEGRVAKVKRVARQPKPGPGARPRAEPVEAPEKAEWEDVALKQTISHMAGKELTPEQGEANKKLSGMKQAHYAFQLLLLLDNDLVQREDKMLMEALCKLHEALRTFFEGDAVAA